MGLNYVFPIWFTQCGRVWSTHTSRDHAARLAESRYGHDMAMCELKWAVERRSDLSTFGFFQLLRRHRRRGLTRKLLPFAMWFTVLMTMETADYTEYELTLKLKTVFLLLIICLHCVFFFAGKTSPLCCNYTIHSYHQAERRTVNKNYTKMQKNKILLYFIIFIAFNYSSYSQFYIKPDDGYTVYIRNM